MQRTRNQLCPGPPERNYRVAANPELVNIWYANRISTLHAVDYALPCKATAFHTNFATAGTLFHMFDVQNPFFARSEPCWP